MKLAIHVRLLACLKMSGAKAKEMSVLYDI